MNSNEYYKDVTAFARFARISGFLQSCCSSNDSPAPDILLVNFKHITSDGAVAVLVGKGCPANCKHDEEICSGFVFTC